MGLFNKGTRKHQLSEDEKIAIALREHAICKENHDWVTYDKTPINSPLGIEYQINQVCAKCKKKQSYHW